MSKIYDYLIIGAGPAGMTGAIETSKAGLSVLVLDQAASAGSQIYRNLGQAKPQQAFVLGADYLAGRSLLAEFMAVNCYYKPQAQVWHIETHERGFYCECFDKWGTHYLCGKPFVISPWGYGEAYGYTRLA